MPRVQVAANELKNTDVNFVSLVKHGANRIPFRIVKEEAEPMLDLAKIGRTLFRKAETAPAVVAVLVNKSADQAKVSELMTKAGLVMTQKSETTDVVIYMQPGAEQGDRDGTLRLNEDVALVINGLADLPSRVQKDFCPYEVDSTNFMAVLNTEGFYSGMQMALGALAGTVANVMKEAADPSTAATMIEAAIDDFKGYMLPCVKGIPVRAFKADMVLIGVRTAPDTHGQKPGNQTVMSLSGIGAGANANGTAYDPEEDRIRATKAEPAIGTDVKAEPSPVNAHQEGNRPDGHGGKNALPGTTTTDGPIGTDTTKEPGGIEGTQEGNRPTGHGGKMPMAGEAPIGTDTKPEPSPVNADQGRGDATVAGLMKEVNDLFAAQLATFRAEVLNGFTEVKKSVGGVSTRMDGVENRLKKNEEAINGTALGDAEDDPLPRQRAQKNDGGLPPLMDTGFHRAA